MDMLAILTAAVKYGASDNHLVPQRPPFFRINGEMHGLNTVAPYQRRDPANRYPFSLLFLPVFFDPRLSAASIAAASKYLRHPRSIFIGRFSTARTPCSASPRFFTSISPSYNRASHNRGASGMRKSAAGAGNG
jgi:hypothetical protein